MKPRKTQRALRGFVPLDGGSFVCPPMNHLPQHAGEAWRCAPQQGLARATTVNWKGCAGAQAKGFGRNQSPNGVDLAFRLIGLAFAVSSKCCRPAASRAKRAVQSIPDACSWRRHSLANLSRYRTAASRFSTITGLSRCGLNAPTRSEGASVSSARARTAETNLVS